MERNEYMCVVQAVPIGCYEKSKGMNVATMIELYQDITNSPNRNQI